MENFLQKVEWPWNVLCWKQIIFIIWITNEVLTKLDWWRQLLLESQGWENCLISYWKGKVPADKCNIKSESCIYIWIGISSVQFSCSVVSESLQLHESQHARRPCPSPTPRVHSDSRLSSQWCQSAISSSVISFSSCPHSLLASESFPVSQLFSWGGQSTGVSALAIPSKEIPGRPPLRWTGWISLQSKELTRIFCNITIQKHQFFSTQLSLWSNSHIHTWLLEKP